MCGDNTERNGALTDAVGAAEEIAWLLQLYDEMLSEGTLEVQNQSTTKVPTARATSRGAPKKRGVDELHYLRATVPQLEAELAMIQSWHAERMGCPPPESSRMCLAWKAAAKRQQVYLEQSLHENKELRRQVQQQLAIIRRLEHGIDRGHRAMRSLVAPERQPFALVSALTRELKRNDLTRKAKALVRGIDDVLRDHTFSEFDRDFRRLHSARSTSLSVGSIITSSRAGHLLPLPFSMIQEGIWFPPPKKEFPIANGNVSIEDIENRTQERFVTYAIRLSTTDGQTTVPGMAIRYQFEDDGKKAFVMIISQFEPNLATSSFETSISAIVQPHARSTDTPKAMSELLVKIESTAAARMSAGEASGLKSFLMQGHTFFHDELQRSVDDLSLQWASRT